MTASQPCRTSRDGDGVTLLDKLSMLVIRLGLFLQVVGFRRELNRLDDGTVELWGNRFGLDEEGCVCSEAACFFRTYHRDSD